ncbi:MAG: YceI family protein [Micromonosporaceae bacterium]|nr:YceI family protein [Micromonosporaceae bacterium]
MSARSDLAREWNGLTIPAPGEYELDPAHTRVGFIARHLMVAKVRGAFDEVTGVIQIADEPLQSSVTATIHAASITTAQSDRDNHLRSADFLDCEKHPTIEYRSTGVKAVGDNEFVVAGELTIKQASRPVDMRVVFEGLSRDPWGKDVVGFSATAEIDREEFGLTWNVPLEGGGVLVGRQVKIEIEGEAAVRQPG